VGSSDAFGATYGALTGIMALLLWANLTGVALFLGIAFGAQLEARRVGVPDPVVPDQWMPAEADPAPAETGKTRKTAAEGGKAPVEVS
jgi:uncharacterized BrkB/YihY/UPF0761 family membrane protein